MSEQIHELLYEAVIEAPPALPARGAGIDAGLTLTKFARIEGRMLRLAAVATSPEAADRIPAADGLVGVTGARAAMLAPEGAHASQEIEAAARGVLALAPREGPFCVGLMGTGTAFAAVRDGRVTLLGGCALGGGSFLAIGRAINTRLSYNALVTAAGRGDRRRADLMISDAYPEGIGRIGPDLTAAHLAKAGASFDDFAAGLLNLHGESIAQIGAQRARLQQLDTMVLCGGFVHGNDALVQSIAFMSGLFGVKVELCPQPGFAGAVGALVLAAEATG